jgi:hypothetical protein
LTALRAYARTLAVRVGLDPEEVLELLANGRTEADVLALELPRKRAIVTPTMRRLGGSRPRG